MDILYKILPEFHIDFGPDGFLKGAYKFCGIIVSTFLLGGLTAILPVLSVLNNTGDQKVIAFTGLFIGGVKWIITWITAKRADLDNPKVPVVTELA